MAYYSYYLSMKISLKFSTSSVLICGFGRSHRAFLNLRFCLYLWTCVTSSVAAQVQFQFKVRIQPSLVQMPGCGLAPPVLSSLHWMVTCVHRQLSQKAFRTNHQQWRKRELTTLSYNFLNTTVVVSQNVVLRFFVGENIVV